MKYNPIILLICFFLGVIPDGIARQADGNSEKVYAQNTIQSCEEVITWQIGDIDPRYSIDGYTLRMVMEEVGDLWSDAVGRDLLSYNQDGQIVLNLVYSEEQEFTNSERQMSQQLEEMKQQHNELRTEYDQLSGSYQSLMNEYNIMLSEFNEKVAQYNTLSQEVASTNTQNSRLNELRREIESLNRDLNLKRAEVNERAQELERLTTQLNSRADQINDAIYQYNEQFGQERSFSQGIYSVSDNNREINIYQYENVNNLRLVLAHEVGHALGLDHVSNPESVMYYMMGSQNENNLQLTDQDIRAITQRCRN